jgi:hypothetical protein
MRRGNDAGRLDAPTTHSSHPLHSSTVPSQKFSRTEYASCTRFAGIETPTSKERKADPLRSSANSHGLNLCCCEALSIDLLLRLLPGLKHR